MVSSLVQLCLDPFYRTRRGLCLLLSKEWSARGFAFAQSHFGVQLPENQGHSGAGASNPDASGNPENSELNENIVSVLFKKMFNIYRFFVKILFIDFCCRYLISSYLSIASINYPCSTRVTLSSLTSIWCPFILHYWPAFARYVSTITFKICLTSKEKLQEFTHNSHSALLETIKIWRQEGKDLDFAYLHPLDRFFRSINLFGN